jgi:hypothetical protein
MDGAKSLNVMFSNPDEVTERSLADLEAETPSAHARCSSSTKYLWSNEVLAPGNDRLPMDESVCSASRSGHHLYDNVSI